MKCIKPFNVFSFFLDVFIFKKQLQKCFMDYVKLSDSLLGRG